jgi:hypothetical protein
MRPTRYRMVRCDTTTMRSTERRKPRLCGLKWWNGSCVGGWLHHHQRLSRIVRRTHDPPSNWPGPLFSVAVQHASGSLRPSSTPVAPCADKARTDRRWSSSLARGDRSGALPTVADAFDINLLTARSLLGSIDSGSLDRGGRSNDRSHTHLANPDCDRRRPTRADSGLLFGTAAEATQNPKWNRLTLPLDECRDAVLLRVGLSTHA